MTREAYHKQLKDVQDDLSRLAEMVAIALKDSMDALGKRDIEASSRIIKNDVFVNNRRFEIEERCIYLIATQQPMAVDLRTLAAIINVVTDLERIGDHAEGIARISISIGDKPLVKPLVDMPVMAAKAMSMLTRCMQAFIERDAETAKMICDEDDEVDALYDAIYDELIHLMIENPQMIKEATYLIWAAHNIERIADRVTNIAERVVYMVTGKMQEMNVSKY
ncbi:MAG: phosphate transport system regulatory protein PhoU [Deltaproteobacteria bacterium RIFCSPLOWO2_02_FULL_53_8]|nr:MAG: phosphate transport system regulatory protein PhoU [Deltaproteobacteria bacterium RIFCSPLOWO2_02_FULL_53_8]